MILRRFKQQLAGRLQIPLKRWTEQASYYRPAGSTRRNFVHATSPATPYPLTQGKLACHPAILLGGPDQPTLLRYLEGWPRRWPHSRTLQIRFADQAEQLRGFADDSFDFAVVQSPGQAGLAPLVRELTRVARQGVITRRR